VVNTHVHLHADTVNWDSSVLEVLGHVVNSVALALVRADNVIIVVEQLGFGVSYTGEFECILHVSLQGWVPGIGILETPFARVAVPADGFIDHIPSQDFGVVGSLPDSLHDLGDVVLEQVRQLTSIEVSLSEPRWVVHSPAEVVASELLAIGNGVLKHVHAIV